MEQCDREYKLRKCHRLYILAINMLFLSPAEKLSPERVKLVMEHIWRMQEFCNSMTKLSPDAYEYAYLKAIVLFSPGA